MRKFKRVVKFLKILACVHQKALVTSYLIYHIISPTVAKSSLDFAHIMIFASSMKSSSDMEPSLIILMATSCFPCHFPYFTTPNWPVPRSLMKVR